MLIKKFFLIGISISLILHGVFLFSFYARHADAPKSENKKINQMVYDITKEKAVPVPLMHEKEAASDKGESIVGKVLHFSSYEIKEDINNLTKVSGRLDLAASPVAATKTENVQYKYTISVPVIESEEETGEHFESYYRVIGAKIRQLAYRHLEGINDEAGEVYLSFVLEHNGQVKSFSIKNEKTSAGVVLQQIVLQSIREASPFPPFPADLSSSELSLGVIISFQNQ